MSDGPFDFNTRFMPTLLMTCSWNKPSNKNKDASLKCLTLDIIKKSANPKSASQNEATWQCLLLLPDWLHEMCVILTHVTFQFKSRGQGFGVNLGFESQSDSNLTEQDEINELWPPRGLLTPVCLSPGSRTRSLPPRRACLVTNQFHLDGSQNKLDPASHDLYYMVERLWSD